MFARTERLLLRPGWPEDAPAVHAAINDQAVVRNLGSAPWPYEREDAEQFLSMERPVLQPNFLIFRRTAGSPQLVGSIGFGDLGAGELEIGYWIARGHWGRGYATEAGRAAIEIARAVGHRDMLAEHFVDNPGSGKVLRKLGFRPTGQIAPRYSKGRGEKVDAVQFRLQLAADDDSDIMRPMAA
ncbi:GNAT family N-acetyltransferase [Parasphingorhabdus flavimaris]|jgi:RimJ/RimL family protein N-acetyltransferase|uniref:GNAT family N-acetyltransferase n=1 Tax=Parasphingorhabdus flavimaris TaxID=266812 RepID=A0ABX2N6L3_9SPHN|nr:GNAT family N-acetyltransferase [Parasphingorhabdus flavimaris]NVD29373.1 GNAT family N-acetyltransferase [Parasphingorhabdus flavimaris]|tara:strand:- start:6651 stop:7202 length:552 start_codon:yes stop_codon:yes gene_type:complete